MKLQKAKNGRRRGAVLVLAAIMLVVLFGMVAFAVDMGYVALVRTQLQRVADSAAQTAALNIGNQAQAISLAQSTAISQQVAGAPYQLDSTKVEFGMRSWNGTNYTYQWNTQTANCVRVTAERAAGQSQGPISLFFAPVLGMNQANVTAQSIASINPRDIVFVVDLSGSMHHDSEPWSTDALNWLSQDGDGVGAGDAVMQDVWEDLGLTASNVPYPLPDTPEYRFDFASRNNIEIELPVLTGNTAEQSRILYRDTTGAGNSNVFLDANGNIKAKFSYSDIDKVLKSSTITSIFPDSSWTQYAHTQPGVASMHNYDFIIDKYFPTVMQHAKPPVTDSAYRDYWRGYAGYVRGFSSGLGSSKGIKGWANPSDSYYADQFSALFVSEDGQNYPGDNLIAELNAMVNKGSYKSYIQFMMDHGFNSKPGRDIHGNSSPCCYTPMSMRWEDDGMPAGHAYRRTDSDGFTRPPREQPAAGVSDALIAGIKELKSQNQNVTSSLRDRIAVVVFHSNITAITGTAADPFTDNYDQVIQDVIEKCSQGLPNGTSNIDGTAGSTNTQHGMRKAYDWINAHGRTYANKVTVLFTDGVANTLTNAYALNDYNDLWIDIDGDGTASDQYYYSTDASDPKNAALKSVSSLHGKNTIVHTVTAGAGKDSELTRRMSLLTNGIWRDSGSTFHDYASNLVQDFQDLANHRAVSFGL